MTAGKSCWVDGSARPPQDARRQHARVVVALRLLGDVPREDAREQTGRVPPHVVVGVVLDELEAADGDRTLVGIAREQAIVHPAPASIRRRREQGELAVLALEAAAELRTVHRSEEARPAEAVTLKGVQVVDLDPEVRGAAVPGATPRDQPRVVVADLERDPAVHALREAEIRRVRAGHRSFSFLRIPSETRSAKAAIVKLGFTPTGPGIAAPSATYRPRWPKTSPHAFTTP